MRDWNEALQGVQGPSAWRAGSSQQQRANATAVLAAYLLHVIL